MQLEPRAESVLTGKANLEQLHCFPNFPVFFGTVDKPATEDLHADMDWAIDPETGVVQLTRLIPLDVLYSEQHVDGCGPTWKTYYEELAAYILSQGPRHVVEIGGGAGVLAKVALSRDPTLHWALMEPNPTISSEGNLEVVKGFFHRSLLEGRRVDAVVFSQVMEHVYNPRQFLRDIAEFLSPGQQLIFAYPNLALWLEKKYTNALNFEHTMLLTDRHLDTLLPEYGLEVVHKAPYREHSFFYTATKRAHALAVPPMPNLYADYKRLFLDFISHHREMVDQINREIRETDDEVYLFGAHIFSTFLFAFGLDATRIQGVLDNSPTKEGRRLYGTDFSVQRPGILRGKRRVSVILRAGHFNQEIREDIVRNINPDVRFI